MDYSPYTANVPARVSVPPPDMATTRPSTLLAIIARIEEALDDETHGISTDRNYDLKASNARKSRCLYELTKATRGLTPQEMRPEHRDGMVRLRGKLERNASIVRAHMDAVGEVASLIQTAIQRAEDDGTYSSGEFGR